jgi:NAD(P)-dependent dehydrogenase (short-subunit alcohol dehydrogenase family)
MIVLVTSGYALLPATRAPTYSATKAGLRSFTMALRRQVRDVGIRVVEVLPPLARFAGSLFDFRADPGCQPSRDGAAAWNDCRGRTAVTRRTDTERPVSTEAL